MKLFFQIFCFLGFFLVFGYLYGERYWDFYNEYQNESEYIVSIQERNNEFLGENIEGFIEEESFYITPDVSLLDNFVEEIKNAKTEVFLEAYIFTEKRILEALIGAHNRGIKVQVLLENNPYKAPYINDKHFNALKKAGLDVKWSDPLNYSLNHAKLLIVDENAYISTGNFSYSLFKSNKDFIYKTSDSEIVGTLKTLFSYDFNHKRLGVSHPNIILSPDNSRSKLSKLIEESNSSIDMYFPYIQDDEFEKKLFEKSQDGIEITLIVEKNFYKDNKEIIQRFEDNKIHISPLSKYKLHSKAILFDDEILYIGSVNFSRYSFDENREIGILIKNQKIIEQFQKEFDNDL